jgi:beta-1,2-mannobiose phosphorylase / 1,2-beta-oligomannan phosphorylase
MIHVKKEGVVIAPRALGFEAEGVLNPAIIAEGETVHVFYRAVAKGNYSSIGYCKLQGPLVVTERASTPVIFPQSDYESHGIEDARIVKIDDLYYLSYTAYDGVNALGALAVSKDLKAFNKVGLITPAISYKTLKRLAENSSPLNERYTRYNKRESITTKHNKEVFVWIKNVVFFPRRIKGKLFFMIRIKPDIQLVSISALEELTTDFWDNYFLHFHEAVLMEPVHSHEISYIGAGCPPIETEKGWLIIYHGVHDTPSGYVYTACAALLDLDNPSEEIARLPYPLFTPEFEYEILGEVNNVCFATGTFLKGDLLYIYYGAADTKIACASVNLTDLLDELLLNKSNYEKK